MIVDSLFKQQKFFQTAEISKSKKSSRLCNVKTSQRPDIGTRLAARRARVVETSSAPKGRAGCRAPTCTRSLARKEK
jgi:hypothetical protein